MFLQLNLCESELRAVDHVNTKFSKGYKATGVGGTSGYPSCLTSSSN